MFPKFVRFSASLLLALSFSFSSFPATAGQPSHEGFTSPMVNTLPFERSLEEMSPPVVDFSYSPGDPSIYDSVQFNNASDDPDGIGFKSASWDFGDGTTSAGLNPVHQYSADGDYTVFLLMTTTDERTATFTRLVSIRTHDVSIQKISSPKVARPGQWWRIHVEVRSLRYVEPVRVELYKSIPGGYQYLGSCTRQVPDKQGNPTTRFTLTYIFIVADNQQDWIHFKAIATITNARDAVPADNEAISDPPTKIK